MIFTSLSFPHSRARVVTMWPLEVGSLLALNHQGTFMGYAKVRKEQSDFPQAAFADMLDVLPHGCYDEDVIPAVILGSL